MLWLRPSNALRRRVPIDHDPLGHRESTKLLDLLTSTFRRHLDNDHPNFNSESDDQNKFEAHNDQINRRPHGVSHCVNTVADVSLNGGTRADGHFRSILTNPLLSYESKEWQSARGRDPMEVFDRSVALGTMTMKGAALCLKAKKLQISALVSTDSHIPITRYLDSHLTVRSAMKCSGAGRQVLKHLLASGLVDGPSFWENEQLTAILTQYLVAEGLQDYVWSALSYLADNLVLKHTPRNGNAKEQQTAFHHLLSDLVVAEAFGSANLDSSCSCLLKGAKLIQQLKSLGAGENLGNAPWKLFKVILGRMNFKEKLQVTPSIFDSTQRFFDADNRLYYPASLLRMLHPTQPSPEMALKLICGQVRGLPTSKKNMLRLGLITASFFKEHQDFDGACFVLTMLAKRYPQELGTDHGTQYFDKTEETLTSLLRLEVLGIA